MKPLTSEWVAKAEGDFNTAERELLVPILPNFDAVCFHSQQSAEKYLKAKLQEEVIPFSKTHNLVTLLQLCIACEPSWTYLDSAATRLNVYAVDYGTLGNRQTI